MIKAKFIIILIFLLSSVMLTSSKIHAQSISSLDYDFLITLQVNHPLPEMLKSSPLLHKVSENENIVYIIESTVSSNPHIIHTDEEGVLLFVQLTIPKEYEDSSTKYMQIYGEPELKTARSRAEVLYGYPSKGISFIVNQYSGRVIRVQKYLITNQTEYKNTYAANYIPDKNILTKTRIESFINKTTLLIIGVITLIGIMSISIWFKRRTKLSTPH